MRLRDMLSIIDESLPKINAIQFNIVTKKYTNEEYKISNISSVYKYLKKLKEINPLKNDINYLFEKFNYIITEQLELNIDHSDFNEMKGKI